MKKTIAIAAWLLLAVAFAYAQTATITGKVVNKDGTAVPGASVRIPGRNTGVASEADGSFKIKAQAGDVLQVTAIGYMTTTIKAGSTTPLVISLIENTREVNEVVVTALGIKRDKRMLTYSVQEVKGAALTEAKQDNVVNALAGKVVGVQISNSSGIPGSSARIVIRGNSSLVGDNQALFVIDGIPMDNSEAGNPGRPEYSGGTANRASDIDPNIIESISVLKGAAATAL